MSRLIRDMLRALAMIERALSKRPDDAPSESACSSLTWDHMAPNSVGVMIGGKHSVDRPADSPSERSCSSPIKHSNAPPCPRCGYPLDWKGRCFGYCFDREQERAMEQERERAMDRRRQ